MEGQPRVVLVTGAAGGFGREIAEKFLAQGAVVHGCDRDEAVLTEMSRGYNGRGWAFSPHAVDLSQVNNIMDLVDQVHEQSDSVDVLINCAGVCTGTTIFDMTEREWDLTYSINVKAPFFLSQRVAKRMLERSGSDRWIINISSLVSFTGGILSSPAYSSSKSALTCTTKNFAKLLAPHGITVNEVAPGTAKTELSKGFIGNRFDEFEKMIPLRRLCLPRDVADTVAFIASREASYITGQTLHVDGGMYI